MKSGAIFEDTELQLMLSHYSLPLKKKIPSKQKKKKVIVIAGPTGVGKSQTAIRIAQVISGEIISADSMQVYKGMDIGTAKVSLEDRKLVPHHLIDVRELSQTFNVVDFYNEAMAAIKEILAREHVPIVVGGTGFYIHALLYGPPSGPPSVHDVRQKLENEMNEQGPLVLYERLKELDPEYAKMITHSDRQKIIRALEIIALTNQKVSSFFKPPSTNGQQYDFRCWFLTMPKEILYPRIEMRCDKMIAEGFIDEVRGLEQQGLRNNLSASQAIGYRQCLEFLSSGQSSEEWESFVMAFKQASRRYAKRQFTWFRKEPLFRWLDVDALSVETVIEMIIQDYELSF